ncbi:hypothetical protein H701_04478 [Staphylococcus epidermidis 528m]|nr:hypothetical protein H701_04478 [Staphylococcus epidermidis 528m]
MVHELGTVGMVCPFPLIEAQKKMNQLNQGDELKIDFDCTQLLKHCLIGLQKMDIQLQTMSNLMMHHGRLLFKKHKNVKL